MSDPPAAAEVADTTLVCAPSGPDGAGGALCRELLSGSTGTVVWVTYTRIATECLDAYRDAAATNLVVVAAGRASERAVAAPDGVSVEYVPTPNDTTALGVTMSQLVARHETVTVCFDSLTELLEHISVEQAYEFLHVLTRQLHAADAAAHVHLDPTAHDRQTVALLTSLFDVAVEPREDGWKACTR